MVRMPHWPLPNAVTNRVDFRRENIINLLKSFGSPELHLPPILHVAGTNGKGSVCAFLKAILEAAKLKCHVYTSPHLVRFNERIVIAGHEISDEALYKYIDRIRIASEETNIDLTFFEAITAAAFLSFSETPADYVILETGMGGRLDATNIVPDTRLNIITTISFDHTEYLGNTLSKIAFEKAGIMRKDKYTIISKQEQEAFDMLNGVATKLGSHLYAYEYDYGLEQDSNNNVVFSTIDGFHLTFPKQLALSGLHQYYNASSAVAAIHKLQDPRVLEYHIIEGLTAAKWPGRIEYIGDLTGQYAKVQVFADGAHNEGGAEALSVWLKEQPRPDQTMIIIGVTRGRDPKSLLKHFINLTKDVIGVTVSNEPSSVSGEIIAEAASELGFSAKSFNSIEHALDEINENNKRKLRILVTGSLFLVGELKERFTNYIK